ncbi:MAG: hypothetical protein ACD_58C00028G0004 [uncultured bacterium]|nr:MAG: hypothetical protein ACD_58C00028G0004 [uncultured bacterium]
MLNNFFKHNLKRKLVIITPIIIVILVIISNIVYLKITKQKYIYIYSNTKDYNLSYQVNDESAPYVQKEIGNLTVLKVPAGQDKGVIRIEKDGYLEKVIDVENEPSPINLTTVSLVKADEIILPSIISNSPTVATISPSPVIVKDDPNKIYYLSDDNIIILLDNSPVESEQTKSEILQEEAPDVTKDETVDVQENPIEEPTVPTKEIAEVQVNNDQEVTMFGLSPNSNYMLLQTLDGGANVKTLIIDLITKEQKNYDNSSEFIWSNDNQLFNIASDNDNFSLAKSDVNLSNNSKVLDLPKDSYDLTISPDNNYGSIIYRKDNSLWAYIYSLDGNLKIDFDLNYDGDSLPIAKWSADSKQIAFFNNQDQVFIYDVINKKQKTINLPVIAGIFTWNLDRSNYYYLIYDENRDMPFIIKDRNNKQIAEFMDAPQSLNVYGDGNLYILFNDIIERINLK